MLDLYRRQISLRKLSVFVEALPEESATTLAQRKDNKDPLIGWSLTDILIGRYMEMHMDGEIVPRPEQAGGKPATPPKREIKTVSPSELMGFVTSNPQQFGEELAAPKE